MQTTAADDEITVPLSTIRDDPGVTTATLDPSDALIQQQFSVTVQFPGKRLADRDIIDDSGAGNMQSGKTVHMRLDVSKRLSVDLGAVDAILQTA